MGLSASLDHYIKTIINKHENPTNILKTEHKKFKGYTQWAFLNLGPNLLLTEKIIKNRQQNKDNVFLNFRSLTK